MRRDLALRPLNNRLARNTPLSGFNRGEYWWWSIYSKNLYQMLIYNDKFIQVCSIFPRAGVFCHKHSSGWDLTTMKPRTSFSRRTKQLTADYEDFVGLDLGCHVTKFSPHKALKSIAWGRLTSDKRVVVYRVALLEKRTRKRNRKRTARGSVIAPRVGIKAILSHTGWKKFWPEIWSKIGE